MSKAPKDAPKSANPVGRPSKYDAAMCDIILKCGREGFSKAEMASELDVTRATMDEWGRQHPEFLNAIHRAQELSLGWWEKQSRINLATSGFQSGLWKQAMSGRFPNEAYRDRAEIGGFDGAPIEMAVTHTTDPKRARAMALLLAKAAKKSDG